MPVGRVLNQKTWVFLEEYLSIRNCKTAELFRYINNKVYLTVWKCLHWFLGQDKWKREMGEIELHVRMADITWKTKRVRWNRVIVRMWELRKMIIDSWRQRCKLQMKHLLRRGKKNFFWLAFFLCNLIWKTKRREKQLKEASCLGEDWHDVRKESIGKDGISVTKQWQLFFS